MGARRILTDRRVARTPPTCAAARALLVEKYNQNSVLRSRHCGIRVRPLCNTDASHGLFSSGHCNGRPTPHLYG
jgi:hypothetical protein